MERLTHSKLTTLLAYDKETGVFTWKCPPAGSSIGSRAGGPAADGRWYIRIEHRSHGAHRLAWFYVTGKNSQMNVVPINGDFSDTRIANLREEDLSVSAARGMRGPGKNTHRGVCYDRSRSKWLAHVKLDGKHKTIGRYDTEDEAVAARKKFMADHGIPVGPQPFDLEKARADAKRRSQQSVLWRRVHRDAGGITGWATKVEFLEDVWAEWKPHHVLHPVDPSKLIGPGNWRWDAPLTKMFNMNTLEGRRAHAKESRRRNPNLYRNQEMRRNFGIELADYHKKLVEQNGVCAICQKPETIARRGKVQPLAVDHCHDTGAIRDLLCERCNKGIGFFLEDPSALEAAALYLRKHVKRIAESGTNVIPIATGRRTTT